MLLGIPPSPDVARIPIHVALAAIRSAANNRDDVADYLQTYGVSMDDKPLPLGSPSAFLDNLKHGVYDEQPRP